MFPKAPRYPFISFRLLSMLWFNFILGLNFIFFCFWVWQYMMMRLKQRKIKFTKDKLKPQHLHQITKKCQQRFHPFTHCSVFEMMLFTRPHRKRCDFKTFQNRLGKSAFSSPFSIVFSEGDKQKCMRMYVFKRKALGRSGPYFLIATPWPIVPRQDAIKRLLPRVKQR